MGPMCLCPALLLLSLTGGMFLLAKTKKDNLGIFFKGISWLVITVSLASMAFLAVACLAHGCRMHPPMNGRENERHQKEMKCKEHDGCKMKGTCKMDGHCDMDDEDEDDADMKMM